VEHWLEALDIISLIPSCCPEGKFFKRNVGAQFIEPLKGSMNRAPKDKYLYKLSMV
jgi:hypothetical protein